MSLLFKVGDLVHEQFVPFVGSGLVTPLSEYQVPAKSKGLRAKSARRLRSNVIVVHADPLCIRAEPGREEGPEVSIQRPASRGQDTRQPSWARHFWFPGEGQGRSGRFRDRTPPAQELCSPRIGSLLASG